MRRNAFYLLANLLATAATCAVINVPGSSHDTVLLADGIYYENLQFPTINLTLGSHYLLDGDTSHLPQTVVDGSLFGDPDSASVIYMDGGQDSTTVICGLTIRNGKGTNKWYEFTQSMEPHGGGCFIKNSSPTIKFNCFIADSATAGGGIYLISGVNPVVEFCEFFSNYAATYGGGAMIDCCQSVQFKNNDLHDNFAHSSAGITSIVCNYFFITDNHFHHNTGYTEVSGLFSHIPMIYISENVIEDNIFLGGEFDGGTGIGIVASNVIITNNQFHGNSGAAYGALAVSLGSTGTIAENIFIENSSLYGGNGVGLWDSHFVITENQFIENFSPLYSAALFVSADAGAYVENNLFLDNQNDQNWGSAVSTLGADSCILRFNTIAGNSPPAVNVDTQYFPTEIDARWNWWGDLTGPYHPSLNPNGRGDTVGEMVIFDPWLTEPVGVHPGAHIEPLAELMLFPPSPNPFNSSTIVSYRLQVAGHVSLKVYDTAGRLVATLVEGWREAGEYQVTFDGSGLPSGVYLYRLQAGENMAAGKLVLLK
jgi:hypothetical protein